MSLPEEDLTCPVCCDIFTDPVLLSCSHSFCRSCVKRCWETGLRECPVCRKRAGSKFNPPSNLALRNVCASLLQVRSQAPVAQEEKTNCGLHGERLKLFCLVDKQPICVVCQSSKLHKTHDCSPIEEAVLDCKVRGNERSTIAFWQLAKLTVIFGKDKAFTVTPKGRMLLHKSVRIILLIHAVTF